MAGVHFQRLERLFAQYRSKVEGCLELHFFGSSQRAAGEIFRKGLTKSRRQSGAVLFRVIATGHLGSLAVGGKKQPKVVRHEHFFRVHLRRLERPFAGDQPKAEGRPEPYFFGSSQRATWGGLAVGVERQPKVVRHEHFFRVHLRRLAGILAGDRPKAEGRPELLFFELSQQATWGASRSVGRSSRR
ncbi:hypothetical protein T229_11665 [Tannerella sp. oral taxon BU063 isolate Cell 5]|uniref:Uncharacterized protein n=1 Tax=Tannerella sp. oral taxon BU063 isolate Cell 5 TaxID=1410950 RepID=W2CBU6_9BACT|nr:hypothetical protein T229_11665 [Tannerella sp. oral taxon BU063 isolate Cell 5]